MESLLLSYTRPNERRCGAEWELNFFSGVLNCNTLTCPFIGSINISRSSVVAQMVKRLPAMRETRFDPWVGKIPGEGNANPLQYSCLENSMDGGAW